MAFMVQRKLFAPVLSCKSSPSLTRQEFQHDADINVIVNKFLKTGVLDQPNLYRSTIDGFASPGDFTEACEFAFDKRRAELLASNDDSNEVSKEDSNEVPKEDSKQD